MAERDNFTKRLWKEYGEIHQKSPNPDSQEKATFYLQHSGFIKGNSHNPNPELAVIIPAYNEEGYLARTLASINTTFESNPNACLLVVDNASTDATAEIVQEFGGILVREPKKGIGQARQTGLESVPSSVKYILTTDADTVVQPDWVFRHQEVLSQLYIVSTYGGLRFRLENSARLSDKFNYFFCHSIPHLFRQSRDIFNQPTGGSNNGFRKESAIACGGYNRNLTHAEDFDLYKKLLSFGYGAPIDSDVTTSARRFVGENPLLLLTSIIKNYLLQTIGVASKNKEFVNQYEDYRSK